ncbi:citryl-CoA lyase [Orrella sp. JC864]|uniref:citryl-CoA lyase n=1 Tax=Orrella sp. JC864 TaxID=3120298 RepID=UPI0012BC9EDA
MASKGTHSAIAQVRADAITVRGQDLCKDLIGKVGFTDYFLLLLTGERPTPRLSRMVDACLVAIAEHGLVPSIQAARMTYAAAPDALQGAVSAGLLGCGSVILGASETAGQMLARILGEAQDGELQAAALAHLKQLRQARLPLPGFGHPVHRQADPRAQRLLALAQEEGVAGRHVQALRAVEGQVQAVYGRFLPMNVSAAIPAVLLDAGFPLPALRGIPLLARTASLLGHLMEEREQPLGFRLAELAEAGLQDGPGAASA